MKHICIEKRGYFINILRTHLYPVIIFLLFHWCAVSIVFGQTTSPTNQGTETTNKQTHKHSSAKTNPALEREPVEITIPDITMLNQNNQKVNIYKDLMKNKMVVLNVFYTSCTGVCPTTAHWLAKLQSKLGDRLGKDVVIISMSIDPDVDTPEKMKLWSSRWNPVPGWTLLTSKTKEAKALVNLFLNSETSGLHSAIVFVGDARQNVIRWSLIDVTSENKILLEYFDKTESR